MDFIHHSAAVHMPLSLAFLFPLAYVTVAVAIHRQHLPGGSWWLLIGLLAVQMVSIAFSDWTGNRDRLLSSGTVELLDRHQNLAYTFSGIWLALFLLIPLAFSLTVRLSRLCHVLILLLSIIQLGVAMELGRLGGSLVFG